MRAHVQRASVLTALVLLAACARERARTERTRDVDRPVDFVLLDAASDGGPIRARLPEGMDLGLEAQLDEVIVRSVSARLGESVADVGCGGGRHALRMAEQVGAAGSVHCRDLAAGLIERLRAEAVELGLSNLHAEVSLPEDARLPEASVDAILLSDVYGMVAYQQSETKERFLHSLFQSLRPGGRVVVCYVRSVRTRRAKTVEITTADFRAAGFEPGRHLVFDTLPDEPVVLDFWRPED